MYQREVSRERTGWRDQQISERHRLYGWDCPGVDLDFLMLEFDTGKPSALVEYKAVGAAFPNLKHPSYCALRSLADSSNIPLLVVFYDSSRWLYRVTPANRRALNFAAWPYTRWLSEREYVSLLYRIRGRAVPADVIAKLIEAQP